MKNKNRGDLIFGLIVTICTIVLLGSIFIFKDKLKTNDNTTSSAIPSYTESTVNNIDINNQPVLGNKNAPVTIVEFGDYKCPACGYFANSLFPQLDKDFISTGKVKLVFENFPFIYNDSTRTAIFQEGVYKTLGNDAFWKMHETIYNYQNDYYGPNKSSNEQKDILTEKYLLDTAISLFGKNKADQLKNAFTNKDFENEVYKDLNVAKTVNINSTPTLFVNGKSVTNPLDYKIVKGAINEALQQGEQK